MQKQPDGTQRPEDVLRQVRRPTPLASRINRRSISAASALRARFRGRAALPAGSLSAALAAVLRPFTTAERALPVAVAAIVAFASLFALMPNTPQGAVGGTQGRGSDIRLAIGGDLGREEAIDLEDGVDPQSGGGVYADVSFEPIRIPDVIMGAANSEQATTEPGPVLDDGTILTGYAPDTTVADGSDLLETYRVKSGDTLVAIAHKFDVSMMTLWWANKLKSKDDLRIGQVLRIPPVNGLVITVKETDTLESLAAKYDVSEARIVDLNGLDDPTLVTDQVLILPGAKGAPIPTPKPTPKPTVKPRSASSGGSSSRGSSSGGGPAHYSGGSFRWPVVGGGNYISQYYHYGHYGVDIAADYGSRVIAAAGGKVIFAGWKSNGGGWQVWISHG
ncbi:MAG: M23 family metallopeptidase, partial [Chloroflexi bacterium]|nr:M23 family metallopeptidase [Chloroflexota bacterium]